MNRANLTGVARARGVLREHGRIPSGAVAPVIEQSWRRCLDYGLDEVGAPAYDPLPRPELALARERNERLLVHAVPVLETLYEQIVNTESMVLLSDASGVILHSMGDDSFLARAEKVALKPGVTWSEQSKGTNAIGTAIEECSPVLVHGTEHFLGSNAFLTCSASPIIDPAGHLIGVLDVTSDYRALSSHTMALVRMFAQVIENNMFNQAWPEAVKVRFHSRPEFIGTLCEGIAAFAPDGRFLSANRSAMFHLGLGLSELRTHTLASLFDSSMTMLVEHARTWPAMPLTVTMHTGVRVTLTISLGESRTASRIAARAAVAASGRAPHPADPPLTCGLGELDSGDPQVAAMLEKVRRAVARDIPVLIQGETGTGKELLAQAAHRAGPRHDGPFVVVNCAAIPEGLIESELFGYEEGAFTGARRRGAAGRIRQAHGGTLFLDEIGDMPLALQARLLRVLQERSVMPLGGSRPQPVDIALVCATHRRLRQMIAQEQFREDLYYRLNGLVVTLPPLRERTDLTTLVRCVLTQLTPPGDAVPSVSDEVFAMFRHHGWPGNIRQMASLLRTAMAMMDDDHVIRREHLPDDFLEDAAAVGGPRPGPAEAAGLSLDRLELSAIQTSIRHHHGNMSAASRALGISRNTLYRKVKEAGIAVR